MEEYKRLSALSAYKARDGAEGMVRLKEAAHQVEVGKMDYKKAAAYLGLSRDEVTEILFEFFNPDKVKAV